MSVLSFAEEFSRIILRYMKDTSINDNQSKDASRPLTREEIISTISNVLSVHGIKSADIKKILDNSLADSSVNTTVVSTAATSVTPIGSEQDDYVRRSSTSGEAAFRANHDSSRLSLGANETGTNSPLIMRSEYRAQSNPTIRINDIGRSDTFVREKNQAVTINNEDDDVFEDVLTVKMNDLLKVFLNEIRSSLMEIVIKVGKLEEQGYLHSTERKQQSRKSSGSPDVSHLTITDRKSILRSTTVPKRTNLPVAMQRSPARSGTPTSRALGKENVSTRRKSISNMSIVKVVPAKSNKSANIARSMSNLSLLSGGDEVPPSSMSKLAKTSKYAHVQSTIPKPSRTSNRKT